MKQLGLIGYPLGHSFSKKYFTQKFENQGLSNDWNYELFPIESIEKLPDLLREHPNLVGLNVTIPYKLEVMAYLDELDPEAAEINAVNCIKITEGKLKGYNTDVYGFEISLIDLLKQGEEDNEMSSPVCYAHEFEEQTTSPLKALVLGTGGAAKAVIYVLKKLKIPYQSVSRKASEESISYDDLTKEMVETHRLIINTTPLGMTPKTEGYPPIPYEGIGNQHFMYDLIYNPEETLFLKYGKERGAKIMSGMPMLIGQAEKGWEIWNR